MRVLWERMEVNEAAWAGQGEGRYGRGDPAAGRCGVDNTRQAARTRAYRCKHAGRRGQLTPTCNAGYLHANHRLTAYLHLRSPGEPPKPISTSLQKRKGTTKRLRRRGALLLQISAPLAEWPWQVDCPYFQACVVRPFLDFECFLRRIPPSWYEPVIGYDMHSAPLLSSPLVGPVIHLA